MFKTTSLKFIAPSLFSTISKCFIFAQPTGLFGLLGCRISRMAVKHIKIYYICAKIYKTNPNNIQINFMIIWFSQTLKQYIQINWIDGW